MPIAFARGIGLREALFAAFLALAIVLFAGFARAEGDKQLRGVALVIGEGDYATLPVWRTRQTTRATSTIVASLASTPPWTAMAQASRARSRGSPRTPWVRMLR